MSFNVVSRGFYGYTSFSSGDTISFSISGTFSADMNLVYSINGGQSWCTVFETSDSVNSSLVIETSGARHAVIAWQCESYRSGTVVCSLTNLPTEHNISSINVFDYGAAGDWNGTTGTDDTSAFQEAIEYALTNNIRTILIGKNHLITDLDITNKYYCGLIFSCQTPQRYDVTQNPNGNFGNIIVSGAVSQGFDISGTSGLVFENIIFMGDLSNPPISAVFAQRTTTSTESYGHVFKGGGFYGAFNNTSGAGLYNFGGEGWAFTDRFQTNVTQGQCLYFTSLNSLGHYSKFDSTRSFAYTQMTFTSFYGAEFRNQTPGKHCVWFEGKISGTSFDFTAAIESIDFINCYSSSKGSGGQAGSVFLFTDVIGNVNFLSHRDETSTNNSANDADTFAEFISTATNSIISNVQLIGGVYYPRKYMVKADKMVNLFARGNRIYNNGPNPTIDWNFGTLNGFDLKFLSDLESVTIPSGTGIEVDYTNRNVWNNFVLGTGVVNQGPSFQAVDSAMTFNAPGSGFSFALNNNASGVIFTNVGVLATGTLTMCATPVDRQVISISATNTITSFTLSPNSGQSIIGAPTTLAANTPVRFIYRVSNTTWYAY